MSMTLHLDRVSLRLRGKALVEDVTCAPRPGRVTVILGANGAGKSTLLRLMAGDLAPTAGSATFAGLPLTAWRPGDLARRRAVMPQQTRPLPLRVAEVVALGRAPHRRQSSAAQDARVVAEALEQAEIGHLADRVVASLSGGERQRVSLARALAQLPPPAVRDEAVLLLDEPTAALDPAHQHAVMAVARRVAADGVAVVAVLHAMTLALRYGDDALLLRDGRLLAGGSAAAVLTEAHLSATYRCRVRLLADPVTGGHVAVSEPATAA
ncbi:heme ABC transporter ATP-binding protein [Caenispirillum bisanense]|uniref:Iron complex transport system ATP-binding protein n=1 Tax=Caenispirillum bisanense TaxID=414052 RepID=A0A286GRJ3_9PROT|nr:heme ABC transporter ATP-binding protein [Caenispirillum bisanense]SOD98187.1 iron complex transport system ATP-binding protein [Caenispirillum bisanense]